jgi:hypothetical protein
MGPALDQVFDLEQARRISNLGGDLRARLAAEL